VKPGAVDSVVGWAALERAGVDEATISERRHLRRNGLPYEVYVEPVP
jgi:hypothetical protein